MNENTTRACAALCSIVAVSVWSAAGALAYPGNREPSNHSSRDSDSSSKRSSSDSSQSDGRSRNSGGNFHIPEYHAPEFRPSQNRAPEYHAPEFRPSQNRAPEYHVPEFRPSQYHVPEYHAPAYHAPEYHAPDFNAPVYHAPEYNAPEYRAPEYHAPVSLPGGRMYDYRRKNEGSPVQVNSGFTPPVVSIGNSRPPNVVVGGGVNFPPSSPYITLPPASTPNITITQGGDRRRRYGHDDDDWNPTIIFAPSTSSCGFPYNYPYTYPVGYPYSTPYPYQPQVVYVPQDPQVVYVPQPEVVYVPQPEVVYAPGAPSAPAPQPTGPAPYSSAPAPGAGSPTDSGPYLPYDQSHNGESLLPALAQKAIVDIQEAWILADPSLVAKHIDSAYPVQIYKEGRFDYTAGTDDYLSMTRKALGSLVTQSFVLNDRTMLADGRVRARGKHVFYDPQERRQELYVTYWLQPTAGADHQEQWIITAIDAAVQGSSRPADPAYALPADRSKNAVSTQGTPGS